MQKSDENKNREKNRMFSSHFQKKGERKTKNILPRWMICHDVEALPVTLDLIDPVRRCSCEYLVRRYFHRDSEITNSVKKLV